MMASASFVDCGSDFLNDVWKVSESGAIIHSMKTRGQVTDCGGCIRSCDTGPALFVAAEDEVTLNEVSRALEAEH